MAGPAGRKKSREEDTGQQPKEIVTTESSSDSAVITSAIAPLDRMVPQKVPSAHPGVTWG